MRSLSSSGYTLALTVQSISQYLTLVILYLLDPQFTHTSKQLKSTAKLDVLEKKKAVVLV